MSLKISYYLDVSIEVKERLAKVVDHGGAESIITYPIVTPSDVSNPFDSKLYYAELSNALKLAIVEVGDRLTEWRDAVGNDEKEKERVAVSLAKARKAADDESDEEEVI